MGLGQGLHRGCHPHTPLLLPFQGCWGSPISWGGLALTGHMTAPCNLVVCPGASTLREEGDQAVTEQQWEFLCLIWGSCLPVILFYSSTCDLIFFLYRLDVTPQIRKLFADPQGRYGPKHTLSHASPCTQLHTHTPSHACSQLPLHPLLSAFAAPRPGTISHFPSQPPGITAGLTAGVTEVVPADTGLTRVNTPVAICTGGCLLGLLAVLPARKTVVLRLIRTRSASLAATSWPLARPPDGTVPWLLEAGWGWGWGRVGSPPCRKGQ